MRLKFLSAVGVVLSALLVQCAQVSGAQDPVLQKRPEKPGTTTKTGDDGRYVIDVVVTDKSGQLVKGLSAQDFELSDNQKPQKLLGFSAVEQTVKRTADLETPTNAVKVSVDPVEVILVVDAVNTGFTQQGYVRAQVEKLLRSNGGQLAAPTLLVMFTSTGIQVQNQATLNGNAMADLLEKLGANVRVQNSAMGANGETERFQLSAQKFSLIVENESKQPGRKLLLWMGPGWPLIPNDQLNFNASDQGRNYDAIVSLENRMREARMEVFSISVDADDGTNTILYQSYLKPVRKKEQADSADLALQVLAVESGGRVTDPSNDLAAEMTRAVEEASTYYTLRFTPSEVGKRLSYHQLVVKVNRPGLVARSIAGYYESP
jgi:VWFA-related protein